MQRGKYKCKQLKAMRKRIADENGIPLEQKECTYDGPCRGTCPHCEAELRWLERALADRVRLGKVATVAGLSLGLAACGGQTPGGTPMLTTDSTLSNSEVGGMRSEGYDFRPPTSELNSDLTRTSKLISVPEVGELEVVGDVMAVPPPPPPQLPDEDVIVGMVDDTIPIEEGGIDDEIFPVVDVEPCFPGGMEALDKFLAENIQYPQQAKDNNISGKVYVTFVVEADGSISRPRLLRDIGGGCGEEVIRVVKSMPRWNPGKYNGQPVRVQFNLPVSFSLENPNE